MEFLKALKVLFERVGGANGAGSGELTELVTQLLMSGDPKPPEVPYVEPAPDHGPEITALTRLIEEVQALRDAPALAVEVVALRQQVEQLALLVAAPAQAPSYADFLQGYAEPQAGVDWEHPGKIGARTAETIRGTTITATGAFGCNSKAAQTAAASGGALAAYAAGANGLDTGANMSALHALVVSMRAALVANGIMS